MKKNKELRDELPVQVTDAEKKKKKPKNKAKKAIIIAMIVMTVLGAVSWFLLYGKPEILENITESVHKDIIGMYGSENSYIYYPIDDSLDITLVDEYMQLDRNIYYTYGAETFILTEDNAAEFGDDAVFFTKYFEYAIKGNCQAYNGLFTDHYYKTNDPYYSFTQQMIYDIHIEKLSESDEDSADMTYSYNVSYKIFRNNGTFRNDIGSDGSKTLFFELVRQDKTILINKIDYYI